MVPEGVRVDFIKSAFDGALPGHFEETPKSRDGFWWREGTRSAPEGLNDLNREVPLFYVSSHFVSSEYFLIICDRSRMKLATTSSISTSRTASL